MESLSEASMVSWKSMEEPMLNNDPEVMAQLLGAFPFDNGQDQVLDLDIASLFWSDTCAYSYSSSDNVTSALCYPHQVYDSSILASTNTSSSFFTPSECQSYGPSDLAIPTESCTMTPLPLGPNNQIEDAIVFNDDKNIDDLGDYIIDPSISVLPIDQTLQPKRKLEDDSSTESPKGKGKASAKVQRTVKNGQLKKSKKSVEEEVSIVSYSSEDESNASQELNGGGNSTSSSSPKGSSMNLKGKTRAGRGSATDPQSLYARKRRERINERLRILQNLVPNGTKVDISTMLEEAVQYVKFLQLQIKLLSSDDLWMYAPLAYNGMDIGLDLKIPLPRQ